MRQNCLNWISHKGCNPRNVCSKDRVPNAIPQRGKPGASPESCVSLKKSPIIVSSAANCTYPLGLQSAAVRRRGWNCSTDGREVPLWGVRNSRGSRTQPNLAHSLLGTVKKLNGTEQGTSFKCSSLHSAWGLGSFHLLKVWAARQEFKRTWKEENKKFQENMHFYSIISLKALTRYRCFPRGTAAFPPEQRYLLDPLVLYYSSMPK